MPFDQGVDVVCRPVGRDVSRFGLVRSRSADRTVDSVLRSVLDRLTMCPDVGSRVLEFLRRGRQSLGRVLRVVPLATAGSVGPIRCRPPGVSCFRRVGTNRYFRGG